MSIQMHDNDGMAINLTESELDSTESEDQILTVRRRARISGSLHASNTRSDVSPLITPSRRDDYVDEGRSPQASTTSWEHESVFLDRHYRHLRGNRDEQRWVQLKLIDFTIFGKIDNSQPVSLHTVAGHNNQEQPEYGFSGTVVHDDGTTRELEYAEISSIQIDHLGDLGDRLTPNTSTCLDAIFLQTRCAKLYNCFYVLEHPSPSYESHFRSFTWLADFMKHTIDFLTWAMEEGRIIRLSDFNAAFMLKLLEWQGDNEEFRAWHSACGSILDFRQHITCATNASFIYGQAYNITNGSGDSLLRHELWNEIGVRIEPRSISQEDQKSHRTPVTAHAARCFLPTFPLWGRKGFNILETVTVDPEIVRWQTDRRKRLGLRDLREHKQGLCFERHGNTTISQAALKLENSSKTMWTPRPRSSVTDLTGKGVILRKHTKDCTSVPCSCSTYRYAYVCAQEGQQLKVRWLTLPSQTVCAGRGAGGDPRRPKTFYPIGNELFWTDECTCDSVSFRDVVAVYKLLTTRGHAPQTDLFVQFQYTHRDLAIHDITLEGIDVCPLHSRGDVHAGAVDEDSGPCPKARTLSLFSACGLLDLGTEEGSNQLFETVLAVDINTEALLSFAANHRDAKKCEFCNQDIKVLFREFCTGKRKLSGFVLLVGGCPCTGFTNLNIRRTGEKALQDCSLLAHTMSWVELFLPEMVLIENVRAMDPVGHKGNPSAAGQAISFLVSLGYQAKLTVIKASDYGGATSRTRLFIVATRPGIPLPHIPGPTHGEDPTLLPLNTVAAVTSGLGVVDNDVMLNIKHPDHVPVERFDKFVRDIISKIPRAPPRRGVKNNLWSAIPYLNNQELEWYYNKRRPEQQKPGSSCLARVNANKPIGTLVTTFVPLCAKTGTTIHWSQNRSLTLMELRRGQGVPEDFVLIGNKADQVKQIGNSVAWKAANVLGGAFGLSWRKRRDSPVAGIYSEGSFIPVQPSNDEIVDDVRTLKTQKTEDLFYKEDRDDIDLIDGRASLLQDDDSGELPELKTIFTPTPPRKRRWINTTDDDEDDGEDHSEMSDIDEVLTPTRSHRRLTRKTTASEKLQISPHGSVLFETRKESSVTVRSRRPSSRVRLTAQRGSESSFVRRLEASKVKVGSGLTMEDAIMLD